MINILFKLNTLAAYDDLRFFDGAPFLPIRKINHAIDIEKEILDVGFKIVFLYIYSNRKMIPARLSEDTLNRQGRVMVRMGTDRFAGSCRLDAIDRQLYETWLGVEATDQDTAVVRRRG